MKAQTVLIPQDVAEEGKRYLTERGYLLRMGRGTAPEDLIRDAVGCAGLLARTEELSARVLEAAVDLRVIGRHGVGVDNIDLQRATELGIWVTNAPESLSSTVAEHTLGLIICAARSLHRFDRAVRQGDWSIRNRVLGIDLEGKTLGIVGLGRIGRVVARKASMGLGMEILGYDPHVEDPEVERIVMVRDPGELFSRSDFVSLHLPATPETRGMVGEALLSAMKPSAYLINAARGSIVVTGELVKALRAGTIAGAALDVYEDEPLPAGSPLVELENVVLTPHIASSTRECMVRMAVHAAMGIDEVLSGKEPTWPVNRPRPRG